VKINRSYSSVGQSSYATGFLGEVLAQLVAYRSSVVTPDTAEALRGLERAGAAQGGLRVKYRGVKASEASWDSVSTDSGPTGLPADLSMRPTGREVYLSVQLEGVEDRRLELSALWALAIPLGFMPWSRYPVPGPTDNVFHYLGHWSMLADFLHGEGRGEDAWPSMCAAAQCEVGKWGGSKPVERLIQAHLHRLGIHCGPVDGDIGERTLTSLRAIGLGGSTLQEAAETLAGWEAPKEPASSRRIGYFTMKGGGMEAFTSGSVQTTQTRTGYAVTADGKGRLIILFGES
jgi:hypothetical protein